MMKAGNKVINSSAKQEAEAVGSATLGRFRNIDEAAAELTFSSF